MIIKNFTNFLLGLSILLLLYLYVFYNLQCPMMKKIQLNSKSQSRIPVAIRRKSKDLSSPVTQPSQSLSCSSSG